MKSHYRIVIKNPLFQFMLKRRLKKAVAKWNKEIPEMLESCCEELCFKWGQLVWQEIDMWIRIGDPYTPKKEMDWMCERRGFSPEQRAYLIEMMTYVGMYK